MANLFAYRSTEPAKLFEKDDPIGPENDFYLRKLSGEAEMPICA